MASLEFTQEKHKSMPCPSTEKLIYDLEKEGWECEWSFHTRFKEQWNDTCDKVEALQRNGDWKAILVQGQDEVEKKDGVSYIYKKKTAQRIEWEKKTRLF